MHKAIGSSLKEGFQTPKKAFLLALAALTVFAAVPQATLGDEIGFGSITVCKIIIDAEGNVVDGEDVADSEFSIEGFTPDSETSQGAPIDEFPQTIFATPLDLNTNLVLDNESDNDAECATYGELTLGSYYYSVETLPDEGFETPKYNDQFITAVMSLEDFFEYSGQLFDGDPDNDEERNTDSDGHIVITAERPDRTLVILNQISAQIDEDEEEDEEQNGGGGGGEEETQFKLTIIIMGENDATGEVIGDSDPQELCTSETQPCEFIYDPGDEVVLIATPDDGFGFLENWSGDCSGDNPVCNLTMDSDKTVTAYFNMQPPTSGGGGGGGGGSGGGSSGGGGGGGSAATPITNPVVSGENLTPPAGGSAEAPTPQVLGETLPRTGSPVSSFLWLAAILLAAMFKPKLNFKTAK